MGLKQIMQGLPPATWLYSCHFRAHANVNMHNTPLQAKHKVKYEKSCLCFSLSSLCDWRLKESGTETCQKRWRFSHHYQWNDFTRCFTQPLSTDKTECWVQINCLCAVIILPPNSFYQNHYLMAEKVWLQLAKRATTHSYSVSWKLKWPTLMFLLHPCLPHWLSVHLP